MIETFAGLRSPLEIPREARAKSFSVQSEFTRCEVALRCPMFSVKSVLTGEEVYHFDDRAVVLKAGTFLLVPAGASYTVTVRSRWPTVGRCYYWADEDVIDLRGLHESLGDAPGPGLFDLSSVAGELNAPDLHLEPRQLASCFNHWARRWTEQLGRVDRVDPLTRSRVLRGVERARRAMEDDPAQRWTTDQLAALAGQSRSAFSRSFSRVHGLGPSQMLERLRLDRAAQAMRAGTAALTELALDCGYADLPTFSKAFRRRFGMAPSKWRSAVLRSTN